MLVTDASQKNSSDTAERLPGSQQNSPALGSKRTPKESHLWEQAYALLEQDGVDLLVTFRKFLLSEGKGLLSLMLWPGCWRES